jgi:hypothetical protein
MKRLNIFHILLACALVTLCALPAIAQDKETACVATPPAPSGGTPAETPTATQATPSAAAPAPAAPEAAPAAPLAAPAAPLAAPAPAAEATTPNAISIYGEVQSTDPAANSLSVQYYDYDKDEEKTMDLTVDSAAKIENAASLNDIKQGDWVDIKYVISDNKNVAKAITVEKEEEPTEKAAPAAPEEAPEE